MEILLYKSERLQLNEDGTLTMLASNKKQAEEALAYVWGMGEGLDQMQEVSLWAKGDILMQIRRRFPDLDFGTVIDNTDANYKSSYRLMKTSEAWPPEFRKEACNHSVHAEIALTKGLEATERIGVLAIAEKLELGTSRVRQVSKHVARREDDGALEEFMKCENIQDLDDLTDKDRSSRIRYVQVEKGFLQGSTSMPEHREGLFILDLKSRTVIDADGDPHAIPYV